MRTVCVITVSDRSDEDVN